jgi:ribosomal protein L37AE/L43A
MRDGNRLRSAIFTNACAQCGDDLVAPEWSEHINERCVRHLWACEACGYEFETTVYLRPNAERELAA